MNYGLHWKRSDVHWGERGRGNGGKLLGIKSGNESKTIDFSKQEGIYVLSDERFNAIYIGVAGLKNNHHLLARLRDHTIDHLAERWERFSWFGTKAVNKSGKLQAVSAASRSIKLKDYISQMEAVLISATEPALNKQGGSFGEHVDQYRQFRNEDLLGLTHEEMIEELWSRFNTAEKT
jgi:hypothetical protein